MNSQYALELHLTTKQIKRKSGKIEVKSVKMDDYTYFSLVLAIALALLVGVLAYPEPLNPALLRPPPGWAEASSSAYSRHFGAADRRGFNNPGAVVLARLESAALALARGPQAKRLVKQAKRRLRPSFAASLPPASPGEPAAMLSASYDLLAGRGVASWKSSSFAAEALFGSALTLGLALPKARLSATFSSSSGLLSQRFQLSRRLALLAEQGRYESFGFQMAFNF